MPRGVDTRFAASRRPMNPIVYEGRREMGNNNTRLRMPEDYDVEEMYPDDPEVQQQQMRNKMKDRTTQVDRGMGNAPPHQAWIKGDTKVTIDPSIKR